MKRSHDSDTPILELLTHTVGTTSLWWDAKVHDTHSNTPLSKTTCRNLNSVTVDLNWGWSLRSHLHYRKKQTQEFLTLREDKVHLFQALVKSWFSILILLSLLSIILLFSILSFLPFLLYPILFLFSSLVSFLWLFLSYFHHISSSPLFFYTYSPSANPTFFLFFCFVCFCFCLSPCSRPASLPTNSPPSLSHLITSPLLASDKQLQFSPAGYITRVMSAALNCHPLDWQSQLPLPASLFLSPVHACPCRISLFIWMHDTEGESSFCPSTSLSINLQLWPPATHTHTRMNKCTQPHTHTHRNNFLSQFHWWSERPPPWPRRWRDNSIYQTHTHTHSHTHFPTHSSSSPPPSPALPSLFLTIHSSLFYIPPSASLQVSHSDFHSLSRSLLSNPSPTFFLLPPLTRKYTWSY